MLKVEPGFEIQVFVIPLYDGIAFVVALSFRWCCVSPYRELMLSMVEQVFGCFSLFDGKDLSGAFLDRAFSSGEGDLL